MYVLYLSIVSTLSSDNLDEDDDDNLGERSRELECGTSSLQLSDSDDQQKPQSVERGKGETTSLFSRYNLVRKSSHGHGQSGHWKKRLSAGNTPSSPAISQRKVGDYSCGQLILNNPDATTVAMEQEGNEDMNELSPSLLESRNKAQTEQSLKVGMVKNLTQTVSAGLESDSLNENISPLRPNTKRKRRFKRMALDPETSASSMPNPVPAKEVEGIAIPTTSKEHFNIETISSYTDIDVQNLNLGPNNGSKKGTKQNMNQKSPGQSNIDPSASNTGTIKRKKVRSRSAGGTNQLPIMQNVKRVYHAAPSHPSLTHYSDTSSKLNKKQQSSTSSMVISQSISSVVPGKRKRSNNREKSVENDITSHAHPYTYYRNRPAGAGSKPDRASGTIFEHISGPAKAFTSKHTSTGSKCNRDPMMMDCDDELEVTNEPGGAISSSSLSSSDWESDDDLLDNAGQGGQSRIDNNIFIRNIDSDHEADDEQSDWPGQDDVEDKKGVPSSKFHGESVFGLTDDELDNAMLDDPNLLSRLTYRAKDMQSHLLDDCSTLHASGEDTMDQENLNTLTSTARQAYLARMKRLAECVPGREIRAGSRRVRSRQRGFTIKSSSSEQVSRFLQDSSRSELRLTVLRSSDRNKIAHLANLYSLTMRYEDSPRGITGSSGSMLVLSKTGRTLKVDQSPFAAPNTPSSSGGGNISGGFTGSYKHPIEFKRRRKSGPLQSSFDSFPTLELLPGNEHIKMTETDLNMADPSPNINDRIGLMLETSFNPVGTSAACLSSSMVAHQGSIPCSGAIIELKQCPDDDDLPAKSSSTTSEENEEESPLSSPIMEMSNANPASICHVEDNIKSLGEIESGCSNSILSTSFHQNSS